MAWSRAVATTWSGFQPTTRLGPREAARAFLRVVRQLAGLARVSEMESGSRSHPERDDENTEADCKHAEGQRQEHDQRTCLAAHCRDGERHREAQHIYRVVRREIDDDRGGNHGPPHPATLAAVGEHHGSTQAGRWHRLIDEELGEAKTTRAGEVERNVTGTRHATEYLSLGHVRARLKDNGHAEPPRLGALAEVREGLGPGEMTGPDDDEHEHGNADDPRKPAQMPGRSRIASGAHVGRMGCFHTVGHRPRSVWCRYCMRYVGEPLASPSWFLVGVSCVAGARKVRPAV